MVLIRRSLVGLSVVVLAFALQGCGYLHMDKPVIGADATILHARGDTGLGFSGEISKPVKKNDSVEVGVLGDVALVPSYHKRTLLGLGGGARLTFVSMEGKSPVTPFVHGRFGMLHQGIESDDPDPNAQTRNDFGFTGGGGICIGINDKVGVNVTFDLVFLKETSRTDKGIAISSGVTFRLK